MQPYEHLTCPHCGCTGVSEVHIQTCSIKVSAYTWLLVPLGIAGAFCAVYL